MGSAVLLGKLSGDITIQGRAVVKVFTTHGLVFQLAILNTAPAVMFFGL